MPKGTIVVPTTDPDATDVCERIESLFARNIGGYSTYEGFGGWHNGEEIVEEPHARIVVLHENRNVVSAGIATARSIVKDNLDEDEVLTEIVDSTVEVR